MMLLVRRIAPELVLVGIFAVTACDWLPGLGEEDTAAEDAAPEAAAPAEADGDAKAAAAPAESSPKAAPAEGGDEADIEIDPDAAEDVPVASGPKVAWQSAFTSTPRAVSIAADGTLVVVFEDRMKGYLGGAQVWEKEGSFTELLRLQDGGLVTSSGAAVVAFDPVSGDEKFRVDVVGGGSASAGKKRKKDAPPPPVVALAILGSQILAAGANAAFYVIDPPTCSAKQPACLRPAGALDGEYLELDADLVATDDGTRFLIEDTSMRAFDLGLELAFEVDATARISAAVAVPGGKLAVAYGGSVALLDVVGCTGKGSARLSGSSAGPRGCALWRYGGDLDDVAPGVVDGSTLAVNGNRRLQAVAAGTDSWKTPIGAVGRVIVGDGGLLYTMCMEDGPEGPMMSVKAVTADKATAAWVVGLPFAPADAGSLAVDALRFDAEGAFIVAGSAENVAVLSIPEAG